MLENRKVKAETAEVIRGYMAQNPLIAKALTSYLKAAIDDVSCAFDGAMTMEEVCRLQGEKKALRDIYSVVSKLQ
jgi:predicted amino acid dehydrogenase